MIFFLVSASVPIDMGAPSGLEGQSVARRAGACSPRALWIRGRFTATGRDYQRAVRPPKTRLTAAPVVVDRRGSGDGMGRASAGMPAPVVRVRPPGACPGARTA